MGTWGSVQVVTAEFREAADTEDLDRVLGEMAIDQARRGSYHPAGEPRIEWHKITEMDIALNLGAQREAGIKDPAPFARPCDWLVFIHLEVAEDAPVSS
jgi:hypothetical protein